MTHEQQANAFIDTFFPNGTPDSFDSNRDLIAEMMVQFAEKMSNPISVDDRLPESGKEVLILEDGDTWEIGFMMILDGVPDWTSTLRAYAFNATPTYWKPLPEPPTP